LAQLDDHPKEHTLLWTTGQWPSQVGDPPDAWASRIGFFKVSDERAELILEAWVLDTDLPDLHRALSVRGPTRRGEWDVMFATPWAHCWTTDDGPFCIWDESGIRLRRHGSQVTVPMGRNRFETIPLADVVAVNAWLSADWSAHELQLLLVGDRTVPVARREEPAALIDFTYDGMLLDCDTGWLTSIVRHAAAGLGVPAHYHGDLYAPAES